MNRLTEWTGERWIANQLKIGIGDKDIYAKLAAYEDTKLEPVEITDMVKLFEDITIRYEISLKWLEELKKYKNLEERGLLIKLPCKVKDTVFIYADFIGEIACYTVEAIHLGSCTMQFDCNLITCDDELIDSTEFELEDIGKKVFLTREEAEKALEKVNGNSRS